MLSANWQYQVNWRSGARELSESCVSQNSRSLETERPCLLAQGGGSGCYHREIFATYEQIYILSHFLAKTTCKTTCSRGHASGQNFFHILTNHNILNRISNVHLIMIVFEEINTKGNVVTCTFQRFIGYVDIAGCSSARGASNKSGIGKTSYFRAKCVNISQTAWDKYKVTIND